jgi:hypothetical protein
MRNTGTQSLGLTSALIFNLDIAGHCAVNLFV